MVPRKNDADFQTILLSHFHNVIENLFPAPPRVLRVQVVSFIDKQHAANRVFNKLLGFGSAHLLQLVAACLVESSVSLAHTELNQQFAEQPCNRCFAGAGIAEKQKIESFGGALAGFHSLKTKQTLVDVKRYVLQLLKAGEVHDRFDAFARPVPAITLLKREQTAKVCVQQQRTQF
jgi:hypothetical protein